MSDRARQMKPQEVIRALERLGFIVRRTTGSHVIMQHPVTKRMTSVPFHSGDIKHGLLFGITRQAGVAMEELTA
jgi:predicted RNA binding protein YcfA (HicA-like mRNA interferase family)